MKHFQLEKVFLIVVKVRHANTTERALLCWTLYREDQLSGCETLTHQRLTFIYFLVPAQRSCSQNRTACADSQFPIRSQEYSSGEGKWGLEIIDAESWWGSLNYIGNGSREGRGKECSIFLGEKSNIGISLLCFSPSLMCVYERILYVKPHLLCGLINVTSTLAFSEKHSVC